MWFAGFVLLAVRSSNLVGLVLVLVGLLVVTGGLWRFQRHLSYFLGDDVLPVERFLPGWSEVTLTTADGLDLEAWYAPPEPGFDTPVIVLPWAGTRADRVVLGFRLAENGLGAVMVDDRGYAGRTSESGLALDARAAARFVARAAPGHPVVFLGESLGVAVAIELAAAKPPAALILRSPFTSLADLAQVHDRIGSVAAPVR